MPVGRTHVGGNHLKQLAVGGVREGQGNGRQTADAVVDLDGRPRKVYKAIRLFDLGGVGGKVIASPNALCTVASKRQDSRINSISLFDLMETAILFS